jgi:hypothetical protein
MIFKRSLVIAASLLGISPAMADFESPPASSTPAPQSLSARPWDLSIRGSLGHNDNVQLVPDVTTYPAGGSTRASYFALQGSGAYRLYQTPTLVTGATLSFSSLWHEDKMQTPGMKFSDYNFYNVNPGVYATYRFRLGYRPATLTGSYDYLKEDGHNEALHALGLTSHTLKLAGSVQLDSTLSLNASLAQGWDNFEVTFPDPALDNRDGSRTALDLGVRYWMSGGRHNLSAGIGYVNNNAKGRNFDYDGYNARFRFETAVLRPVWLAAEIRYGDRDYHGFIGFIPAPGRNAQRITTTSLQALWPIDRHWSADVFYKHDQIDSNQAEFEADANAFGAGLSYRF